MMSLHLACRSQRGIRVRERTFRYPFGYLLRDEGFRNGIGGPELSICIAFQVLRFSAAQRHTFQPAFTPSLIHNN